MNKANVEDLNSTAEPTKPKSKFTRLHLIGAILTLLGVGLFIYFVASVGFHTVLEGIAQIGIDGFVFIVFLYFIRFVLRAAAWKLSVNKPYKLGFLDALQAVIIGEALSVMIPLGILISGTAKALAVQRRVPFVVGLSSVAIENLFYSLVTGVVMIFGGVLFIKDFQLPEGWVLTIGALIGIITFFTVLGFLMVIQKWHWISAICEKLYEKGIFKKTLKNGRQQVRLFENLIYEFYRKHPDRFLPICLLQVLFHLFGIVEAWFVLSRISTVLPTLSNAFLLESIYRVIMVFFKLIPFAIGVDEAGAQFVSETLALGVGVGVTLAIIRKGRTLFWTGIGLLLILNREFSVAEVFSHHESMQNDNKNVVSPDEVN